MATASIRMLLASCGRRAAVSTAATAPPLRAAPAPAFGRCGPRRRSPPARESLRPLAVRFFGSGDPKESDDPFGVHFQDGDDLGSLGPESPPRYKRDAVTGKFTGEKEEELTDREKKLLNMDPLQEQDYLLDKVLAGWDLEAPEGGGEPIKLSALARRIREDNAGLTTLGRSTESQSYTGRLEDGEEAHRDETGFSKPLSPSEFAALRAYLREEDGAEIGEDEIPVEPANEASVLGGYADTEELNARWRSSSAMRFMDDTLDDDPFSDLLPSDLSPTLLVNRREAKPIPKHLLHHNNLALLRRYITPSGQIMNRVQSRLGAKDQRKIARLIKRARHLGLIPNSGQFVVEDHGSVHEEDLGEDREWEAELKRRGLVVGKEQQRTSTNGPRR